MSNRQSNFPNAQRRKPDQVRDELDTFRRIMELPPIDIKSGSDVQQRIDEYLNICLDEGMMPTIQGVSLALHIHRNTFWEWTNEDSQRGRACRNFKTLQAAMTENSMMNGTINVISAVFLLKNHHHYADTFSVEAGPVREQLPTADEIIKRLSVTKKIELTDSNANGDI